MLLYCTAVQLDVHRSREFEKIGFTNRDSGPAAGHGWLRLESRTKRNRICSKEIESAHKPTFPAAAN